MDTSKIWKKLREEMVADATLVAALGTQTGSREPIITAPTSQQMVHPYLFCKFPNDNPTDIEELAWPSVEIHIFGLDRFDNGPILDLLDTRWSIPKRKPAGVLSADSTVRLTLFERLNCIEVGPIGITDNNRRVWQWTCEYRARAIKAA